MLTGGLANRLWDGLLYVLMDGFQGLNDGSVGGLVDGLRWMGL